MTRGLFNSMAFAKVRKHSSGSPLFIGTGAPRKECFSCNVKWSISREIAMVLTSSSTPGINRSLSGSVILSVKNSRMGASFVVSRYSDIIWTIGQDGPYINFETILSGRWDNVLLRKDRV